MPVSAETRGRVLLIQLDRDAKLNAMDHAMTLGLDAAMNRLEDDDALWAGVLTGKGRAFSAGSDLADPDRNSTERGGPYGLVRRQRRKPLIAAVDGVAYGGGFEMGSGSSPLYDGTRFAHDGVVFVNTIPHCTRRGPETPGVTTRPCEETSPGGVVALDALTGRERFRTFVTALRELIDLAQRRFADQRLERHR